MGPGCALIHTWSNSKCARVRFHKLPTQPGSVDVRVGTFVRRMAHAPQLHQLHPRQRRTARVGVRREHGWICRRHTAAHTLGPWNLGRRRRCARPTALSRRRRRALVELAPAIQIA